MAVLSIDLLLHRSGVLGYHFRSRTRRPGQHDQTLGEYFSGLPIEKSLSIDNVFVWAATFSRSRSGPDRRRGGSHSAEREPNRPFGTRTENRLMGRATR